MLELETTSELELEASAMLELETTSELELCKNSSPSNPSPQAIKITVAVTAQRTLPCIDYHLTIANE
jgi:hypothetical protein